MEIYGRILRAIAFPAWQAMHKKRSMLARLDYLERTQWRSLDELIALQSGALRQLVRQAYRDVASCRARFDAAGISPDDIRNAEDLAKLPTTSEAPEARAPGDGVREAASWHEAVDRRFFHWSGHRLGQRSVHYSFERSWPPARPAFVDRYLRRDVHVRFSPGSEQDLRAAVETIKTFAPDTLFCDTRSVGALAHYVAEEKLRDWDTVRVVCGVERLSPPDRSLVETAFGGAVFETYGFTLDDGGSMLVAGECEAHDGIHTAVEGVVVEIVVTDSDGRQHPAREGEVGEVVITDLYDHGAGRVRFATGNLATQGPSARCSCGRSLPRIAANA